MFGIRRNKAFTFMEMLVAMALMVAIGTCLYSSLYTGFRAKKSAELAVQPVMTAFRTIELIKQDIYGVLPPNGIMVGSFLGTDAKDGKGFDNDSITLYTTHVTVREDDLASGTSMVELLMIEDEDTENTLLIRRVTNNLLSPRVIEPKDQVICRGIESLNFRYYDGYSWLEEWDSTAHQDTLPLAIEIDIRINYTSITREKTTRRITQCFPLPCGVPEEETDLLI